MALINDFLSLIYPRKCEACTNLLFKHEKFICNYCLLSLPRTSYHVNNDNPLAGTFAGRVPVINATSLFMFEKKGRVQKLLHNIKYEGQKDLATFLGGLFSLEVAAELRQADYIIPIPLHAKKQRQRGYNQSECFAAGIAQKLEIPMLTDNIIRSQETQTQTRKRKYERWENVDGIFEVAKPEMLIGKHVLIVDDVITTGATIEAAWQALKHIDGIKISVVAIAFASR